MNINAENLPTLWYTNRDGDVIRPSDPCDVPEGVHYQHSRFPTQLTETILELISQEDVDQCEHPEEDVHATYGWIEGTYGRRCRRCYGSQLRHEGESWPDKWDAAGSRELVRGNSGWPGDLVLAMSRPSLWERAKSFFRTGRFPRTYSLDKAIIIAASNCERCMNALAYAYGLNWGYKEGSDDWVKCNTCCEFCKETE